MTLAPDTWVKAERGTLEEAFAAAGPQGAVRAVEGLSGVRVDHYVELDFAGLAAVTDAVGGITVDVPAPYRSRGHDFAPGPQRLDGERTVAYVRDESAATGPVRRTGTGGWCRPCSTVCGSSARSPTSDGCRTCSRP